MKLWHQVVTNVIACWLRHGRPLNFHAATTDLESLSRASLFFQQVASLLSSFRSVGIWGCPWTTRNVKHNFEFFLYDNSSSKFNFNWKFAKLIVSYRKLFFKFFIPLWSSGCNDSEYIILFWFISVKEKDDKNVMYYVCGMINQVNILNEVKE